MDNKLQSNEPWQPVDEKHLPMQNRRLQLRDTEGRTVEGWHDGKGYRFDKWGTHEPVTEWRYRRYGKR